MAVPPNHIEILLRAANSVDVPDDISWPMLKFSLQVAKVDTAIIDEEESMRLFKSVRRAIEEERVGGMRDASKEQIGALLVAANNQDVPDEIPWSMLKFSLGNCGISIPDSANWLRSFKRFRCTIAGEDVEVDDSENPTERPVARTSDGAHSDSAYESENDLETVFVLLDSCEKYRKGKLSLPCAYSDIHQEHHMLRSASVRCGFIPDQRGVVSFVCIPAGDQEPFSAEYTIIPDDDEGTEADIVFSRKLLEESKKKNWSATQSSDQNGSRQQSRSTESSIGDSEYNIAISHVIGVALQSAAVRNLDDDRLDDLGWKANVAIRGSRRSRKPDPG